MEHEYENVGYWMKVINDRLKAKADAELKIHNLTFTQSRVMAFLFDHGGQTTQKEIEDFLGVAHPTVVGVVSRMEKSGFVATWLDAKDKRNKVVSLTALAREVGQEIGRTIDEREKSMLRGLSEEEVSELFRMLSVIYGNLDSSFPSPDS